jgi:hypothetical protein
MTTASMTGLVGWIPCLWAARLTPKLDILRLTTRGLARWRRVMRNRRISLIVRASARARRSGGKGRLVGDLAADHAQRAGEGQLVGVQVGVQGGLVHHPTDGNMDQQ